MVSPKSCLLQIVSLNWNVAKLLAYWYLKKSLVARFTWKKAIAIAQKILIWPKYL